MTMELKSKLIELTASLLYNKHFYKLILERKYIENFGDLELAKMKNIYEAMIINKKLEENFSIFNDFSIQFNNLVEYRARKEFFDLERQIKDLEKNILENSSAIKELEFYKSKDLKKAIEILVSKTSPFINSSKKSLEFWLKFTQALDKENWKRIIRLSKEVESLRVYKTKIDDSELAEEIERLKSDIIAMKNRYPFTKLEILEDESSIKSFKDQEKKDVKNMIESYQKMTDIYLSTSVAPEWYS